MKVEHIDLRLELRETVDELTEVIAATRERVREGYGFPPGTTAVTACDANGRPLLADMLAAKANALAALAHLETT